MSQARAVVSIALAALLTASCRAGSGPHTSWTPSSGYCSADYQATIGWPDPAKAARVCHCESSGNARALSANGRYAGLFQFSHATWQELGGGDVFDPRTNSKQALKLWKKRGWKPWPTCGKR